MTRGAILVGLLMLFRVAGAGAAGVPVEDAVAAPPAQPAPLTAAQFEALKSIEQAPKHRACRSVPASYSLKAAKTEADLVHYGFQAALPATLLIVLIAAAPL